MPDVADTTMIPPATGVYAAVVEHLPEILREWSALTADEPWMELPESGRPEPLAPVVLALCAAASRPGPATIRLLVSHACRHGGHRRGAGLPDHLLFVEYQRLREATWRALGRMATVAPRDRAHVIATIDVGLTAATRASLYGYHRGELTAAGEWQPRLEALVRETVELQLFSLATPARERGEPGSG